MLRKATIVIINCIGVSFFLFPVGLSFLPARLNTKMILAVFGIIAFGIDCLRGESPALSKTALTSAVMAVLFSVWCYFCCITNGTDDSSYSTYWLSFATWLGGAYGACWLIHETERRLDIETLTFYLALVCVIQCITAILIDSIPSFQQTIDRIFIQGQQFYHRVHRLYGIGASLDSAGVRFSVSLVLMAHQMSSFGKAMEKSGVMYFYFISYAIITLLGSMIARTTWLGASLGLAYMLLSYSHISRGFITSRQTSFWLVLVSVAVITVVISAWLYNQNPVFRQNLRFGFEGFFRWAETGEFATDSTDKLNRTMWIWPKDSRTWILGTGLFDDNPFGTDIGYCRFTLYCGMVGLVFFSLFFIYLGLSIIPQFENVAFLAMILIALTFIIWVKVSTDIFFIYALLLSTSRLSKKGYGLTAS